MINLKEPRSQSGAIVFYHVNVVTINFPHRKDNHVRMMQSA